MHLNCDCTTLNYCVTIVFICTVTSIYTRLYILNTSILVSLEYQNKCSDRDANSRLLHSPHWLTRFSFTYLFISSTNLHRNLNKLQIDYVHIQEFMSNGQKYLVNWISSKGKKKTPVLFWKSWLCSYLK